MDDKKDEIDIDFTVIKDFFKKMYGKLNQTDDSSKEESLNVKDLKESITSTKKFFQRYSNWLVPLLAVTTVFLLAFYVRAQTYGIPVADEWAESSLHNNIRGQITARISSQFPNLPPNNRETLVGQELAKIIEQNKAQFDYEVNAMAEKLRQQFRAPDGTTYLLGIDPYAYFRQTRNLIENGNVGTELKDGRAFDSYYLAPNGRFQDPSLHPYFSVFVYKILSVFGFNLMKSFFFVGALISALSVIPAFFIGRKVEGNVGGFFAALFLSVSTFFVSRTAGESSDTDAYNILFPLLIAWVFLEALGQNEWKKKAGLLSLSGLLVGIYSFTWVGWWFIWYILLIALFVSIIYYFVIVTLKNRKITFDSTIKEQGLLILLFLITSCVFVVLFTGTETIYYSLRGPIDFISIKEVASTSIWPNVLTTVAELNPVSTDAAVSQLGGYWTLFLAIMGIVLLLGKEIYLRIKNPEEINITYFVIFGIWCFTALWSTSKGIRFILLAAPVVAIGFGILLGIIYELLNYLFRVIKVDKIISKVISFGLISLFMLTPANFVSAGYNQGYYSAPSMNDGWYDALSKINSESSEDAIITSWWDFGHWFKAIANRAVTFDGETQNTPQAHWVGKLLLSSDEKKAASIMRMLDCGGNNAFDAVNLIVKDTPKSIKTINDIIMLSRKEAENSLNILGFSEAQAKKVLSYTHCNPPEAFLIASDDMIGKSGVWGHFGAWDFDRASMVYNTNGLTRNQAVDYLQSEFGFDMGKAAFTYSEIVANDPNSWISPWPNYLSGFNGCSGNETIICRIAVQGGEILFKTDLQNATIHGGNKVVYPNSLVFPTEDGINELLFENDTTGFSIILIQNENTYSALVAHPLQAKSLFTQLFFYKGNGLKCFELFDEKTQITGGKILVYNVNWECLNR